MNHLEPRVIPASQASATVHLVCCRETRRETTALCGWLVSAPAEDGPECVVCIDIAMSQASACPQGGRCPE